MGIRLNFYAQNSSKLQRKKKKLISINNSKTRRNYQESENTPGRSWQLPLSLDSII